MNDDARLGEPDCHTPKFGIGNRDRKPETQTNHDSRTGVKELIHPNFARRHLVKLNVPDSFVITVREISEEASDLLIKKQADYGPLNISRAPGGPLNGLRVRIFDKVSRINNLIDTQATPENESLRDSFIDLANYALIALMVLDGTWPELPKE